jgi:hypothetical protein
MSKLWQRFLASFSIDRFFKRIIEKAEVRNRRHETTSPDSEYWDSDAERPPISKTGDHRGSDYRAGYK